MRSNRLTHIALVGAAIAFVACAKEQSNTTTDSAGGAMNADSSAMHSGADSNASGASNNTGIATNDASIMAYLDAVNMADSAGGKLASTKGTSKAVRDFGLEMVKDHHALRAQGQALAKKDSITPTPAASDTTQQQAQHAQAAMTSMAKGAAWDKAYIDHEVAMHQEVLDNAKAASNATQNADIKALIEKAAPVVQKHLDRAQQIQKQLQPST
jgi:putative membrane protein